MGFPKFKFKLELTKDQEVILDKNFANRSKVIVVNQTKNKMYTTVKSSKGKAKWDVMTYRLSLIDEVDGAILEKIGL